MVKLKVQLNKTEQRDLTNNTVFVVKADKITVIGEIQRRQLAGDKQIFGVNWLKHIDFNDYDTIVINNEGVVKHRYTQTTIDFTITDDGMISEGAEATDSASILNNISQKQYQLFLVDDAKFDTYKTYLQVVANLKSLMATYPVYERIMVDENGKISAINLFELFAYIPEQQRKDMMLAIQYSNGNKQTLKALAERMLETAEIPTQTYDLMTQEQQVEAFINFSKAISEEQDEYVTDEFIERMKKSRAYKTIVQKLTEHGFGLSKTQQFNVFQSAGLLTEEDQIFNLSDMGSGKTLMTVESIFLLDLAHINNFEALETYSTYVELSESLRLRDKNLVTPKLSVVSSWIKTFELFYNVEQVSDTEYTLSYTQNGVTYISKLYVAPFTVKSNTISIDTPLPEPEMDKTYLIVDEIHQLVQKTISRSRIFPKTKFHYKTFVLSGTLSNLTTHQWFNFVKLMDVEFNDNTLDKYTTSQLSDSAQSVYSNIKDALKKSSSKVMENQKRYFDPEALTAPQTSVTHAPKTAKENYYHGKYSSILVSLKHENTTVENALETQDIDLIVDPSISDTPNFELFYNLVGDKAITAQSIQIAEELFGDQKTQHNAEVIKTKSQLTAKDIEIIKTLHKITSEHDIYKSKYIATRINNAILNLNDGLQSKNLYELIAGHAENNTRFLTYLTTLDLNVLEDLPQSSMIQMPKLEDTEKFQILKDILEKEKTETFLIVVNDYQAMLQLSKALKIEHLSKQETTHALGYQDALDALFEKQNIVIVPQDMIKSSLDLVQANRLIQYQLNSEISDIIQTQNRINRIGQTRETKAYYIATDTLQENIIELFLETYKNIRVAHKGIVELFVDMSTQVNVVNDYIGKALRNVEVVDEKAEPLEQAEQLTLFDVSTIPTVVVDDHEPEDEPVTHHEVPGQMSLFQIEEHQLQRI